MKEILIKLKKIILNKKVVIIILTILLVISISNILISLRDYKRTKEVIDNITNNITSNIINPEINEEIKGWLFVNGTNINYPFVQTNDNKYYLDHSLDKSKNKNGWIFLDYRNNFNKDKNTIIYGHNMRDNTMFGTLKNLLKEDYLNNKENQDIKIYTDNYIYTYEVFSVYRIETTNDYIEVSFVTNDNFIDLVNLVTKRSIYDFKKEVLKEDKILTLSTCSGDLNKLVVHGVLRDINHYES